MALIYASFSFSSQFSPANTITQFTTYLVATEFKTLSLPGQMDENEEVQISEVIETASVPISPGFVYDVIDFTSPDGYVALHKARRATAKSFVVTPIIEFAISCILIILFGSSPFFFLTCSADILGIAWRALGHAISRDSRLNIIHRLILTVTGIGVLVFLGWKCQQGRIYERRTLPEPPTPILLRTR
jgi:hypothetical protein